jgi:hypothetical protein
MTRIFAILAVVGAVASVAACDQTTPKASETGGARPNPSLVQYTDALAKKANALFGDTIESRAGKAGDQAANRARNAMSSSNYEQTVGDCADDDCAGHDAGFAWAKGKKLEDAETCPSDRGDAFEDGCRAYGETIQGSRDDARGAVLNGKDPPS